MVYFSGPTVEVNERFYIESLMIAAWSHSDMSKPAAAVPAAPERSFPSAIRPHFQDQEAQSQRQR